MPNETPSIELIAERLETLKGQVEGERNQARETDDRVRVIEKRLYAAGVVMTLLGLGGGGWLGRSVSDAESKATYAQTVADAAQDTANAARVTAETAANEALDKATNEVPDLARKEVSKAAAALAPIGSVLAWPGDLDSLKSLEGAWAPCHGQPFEKLGLEDDEKKKLRSVLGTHYKREDVDRLPDYRGLFLRGVSAGTGRDPDAASRRSHDGSAAAADRVGSLQDCALQSHSHPVADSGHQHALDATNSGKVYGAGPDLAGISPTGGKKSDPATTSITIQSFGGRESRPPNVYVHWIIKVK